jgi:hypothetical protein
LYAFPTGSLNQRSLSNGMKHFSHSSVCALQTIASHNNCYFARHDYQNFINYKIFSGSLMLKCFLKSVYQVILKKSLCKTFRR